MKAKFTRGTDHRLGISFEPEIFEEQLLLEFFARWSDGREFRFSSYEQNHPGRTMREPDRVARCVSLTSCWGELVEPIKPEPKPEPVETPIARDIRLGLTSTQIRDEIIAKVGMMADARTPEMQARYDAAVKRETAAWSAPPLDWRPDRLRALLAEALDGWEELVIERLKRSNFDRDAADRIQAIRSETGIEDRKL
jgi:hypothetical protein